MRTAQRRSWLDWGLVPALLVVAAFCSAQEENPSLGDLARQIQAQRAQEKSYPSRVYTNDNFPPHLSSETGAAPSGPESPAKPSEARNGPPLLKSEANSRARETYYRATMRRLTEKLAADQKSLHDTLAMIRQTWDPLGFYTGEETPADKLWHYAPYHLDEPNQYQKLKAIKAAIAADQDAIIALEDQCRREGCLPDWLR